MANDEICLVTATSFRDRLGSAQYPFEAGRYWLFTSKLCPFSQRAEIARVLAGLTTQIGITIAGPVQTALGWNLDEYHLAAGSSPCPVDGVERIPAIYELAEPGYAGSHSIPVLFDLQTRRIVNNESAEIVDMFEAIAPMPPEHGNCDREQVEEIRRFLAEELIGPIYLAGFAKDQVTYDTNAARVFAALDMLEKRLASTKASYLAGNAISAADIHAYPHLVRFDGVFHALYRLNARTIRNYPAISAYLARLAQIPAFAQTLDLAATRRGYYRSWNQPTDGLVVPTGPRLDPATGVSLA